MADKRVDELDDIDALAGGDSFPVRDASAPTELKEVTATQVATFIDAAGAAATAITGTKLDDLATPDDNTDLNATTGHHGLLPKLGGGTTNFLRADGTWAAPAGGGGAEGYKGVGHLAGYTYSTGEYFRLIESLNNISNAATDNNIADKSVFYPVRVGAAVTISDIGFEVATADAGSTVKVAVFDAGNTGGDPGASLGSASVSTASTGYKEAALSSNVTLAAGTLYWVGVNRSSGTVKLRSCVMTSSFAVTSPGATLQNDACGALGASENNANFPSTNLTVSPDQTVGVAPYVIAKVA